MVHPREETRNSESKIKQGLRIMYTNIDGLLARKLELNDYIREKEPNIICLTETKLSPDIGIIINEKYNIWRKDRKKKGGGGVMILTDTSINVKNVEYGQNDAEIVSIQIEENSAPMQTIITTYVPPKTNSWKTDEYEKLLNDTTENLRRIIKLNKKVLLAGDFNCKDVNWDTFESFGSENSWGEQLLTLTMENAMKQWVQENTRYRGDNEPSRLDLVFSKGLELTKDIDYICPLGKSDHVVLEMEIETDTKRRNEEHKKIRRNFRKANIEGLKEYFDDVDWEIIKSKENIQEKYSTFLNLYNIGIESHVPMYKGTTIGKKEWFNKACVTAKRKRDEAWKKLKKNRTLANKENYKVARNVYSKVRRDEEEKYEKDIIDKCKEQPKLFYRFINGRTKSRNGVEKIKVGDHTYDEPKEISEILNKKFQEVFTPETEFNEPHRNDKARKMIDFSVRKEQLMKIIKNLDGNKAIGPDGVSGHIIKECREQLIEPIYDIIKCSIETGEVPTEWKRADIIPIHKGGKQDEPLNYRPISLTSIICKLCEIIIKEQWTKYLENENIISSKQYGFREKRSCVTNLLSFYSRVIEMTQERHGWVDCIYLDLKKAFDKVPHRRLLWKLEEMGGLTGRNIAWMRNYLDGRQMRTIVKGEMSDWRGVTSGVPQGSVLAPIMFLIYINDMPKEIKSYMSLFADDAKLLRKIEKTKDCESLQEDLNKILEWSIKWEMEFNVNKCHVMEMGISEKRPTWKYKMGEEELKKVHEEKDLGVIIQDSLKPEKHIGKIFGETYRMLRNIRAAFHHMSGEMMKKILTTMIRPKLEYAAVIWSPHLKKDINKVERIQRTATKMVPELEVLEYEERLREMGLPTLKQRRERGDMITIYKLLNKLEVIDNDKLLQREMGENRHTRGHSRKLKKGRCLKDTKKHSFPQRSIVAWNNLPEEIVTSKCVHKLKEKLDNYRNGDGTTRV